MAEGKIGSKPMADVHQIPCANCGLTEDQRDRLEDVRFLLAEAALTIGQISVGAGAVRELPNHLCDHLAYLAMDSYADLLRFIDALDDTLAGRV
jgi:hypothetical protein